MPSPVRVVFVRHEKGVSRLFEEHMFYFCNLATIGAASVAETTYFSLKKMHLKMYFWGEILARNGTVHFLHWCVRFQIRVRVFQSDFQVMMYSRIVGV